MSSDDEKEERKPAAGSHVAKAVVAKRTSSTHAATMPNRVEQPALQEPAALPIRQPSLDSGTHVEDEERRSSYTRRSGTTSSSKDDSFPTSVLGRLQQQKAQPSSFVSGVSESDLIPPDLERQQKGTPGAFAQPGLQEERQRPQQQRLEQQQPYMADEVPPDNLEQQNSPGAFAQGGGFETQDDDEEGVQQHEQQREPEVEEEDDGTSIVSAHVVTAQDDDGIEERLRAEFQEHAQEIERQAKESILNSAVRAQVVSDKDGGSNNRKCRLWIFVLAVLVLGGTAAGLAVALTSDDPDDEFVPSTEPTAAPVNEELISLLTPISGSSLTASGTPQNKALMWLVKTPEVPMSLQSRVIELYAVLVFYYALGGDSSWHQQYNFLSSANPCDWTSAGKGVGCSNRGLVTNLYVPENSLDGTLPSEMFVLSNLESIVLDGNGIHGTIPSEMGLLNELLYVQLYFNEFEGTIPPELTILPNLVILEINDNSLVGSIPTLSETNPNLEVINLGFNQGLSGDFPAIMASAPSSLQVFSCGSCSLIGSLSGVNWTRFPNFHSLFLQENFVEGSIPKSMATLQNLEELRLGLNQLTGTIPAELGQRSTLLNFEVFSNFLTGPIPSFNAATDLYALDLEINELEGNLTSVLGGLPTGKLEYLWLGSNLVKGTIPPSISSFSALKVLVLNNMGLTGTIPSELATISSLESLGLSSNFLEGTIPRGLASLPELMYLSLYENEFNDNLDDDGFCSSVSDSLAELAADCGDIVPEVMCSCCTLCWSGVLQNFES